MAELDYHPKRSFFTNIFLSKDELRLRAGWRLIIQTILLLIFSICFGLPLGLLAFVPGLGMSNGLFLGLTQAIEFIGITLSVFLARRFLDKRSFSSLGLKLDKWATVDILSGVVITFIVMGAIYLIQWKLGWLIFEGFAWQTDDSLVVLGGALGMLTVFIFVGWNEELYARGYLLQTLASGMNIFWGVLISSIIFGIMHIENPNATWFSAAGIFFAGLFLAYGYLSTKQLWLSIGLHIGWNFFEGVIFGFPVSGLEIYRLVRITISGPKIWTGGAFGPEAGLIVLPGLILGTALIFVYAKYIRKPHTESVVLS